MQTETKLYLESLIGTDKGNSMPEVVQTLKKELINKYNMNKHVVVNFNNDEVLEALNKFEPKTEPKVESKSNAKEDSDKRVPDLPELPPVPTFE